MLIIIKKISKNAFKLNETSINEIKKSLVGVYITSNKFNEYLFIKDYYKMQMSNIIDNYTNNLSSTELAKLSNTSIEENPEYMASIVENATDQHCSYVAHCCLKKCLLLCQKIFEGFVEKCLFMNSLKDESNCNDDNNSLTDKIVFSDNSVTIKKEKKEIRLNLNFDKWTLDIYECLCSILLELSENSINDYKLEFKAVEQNYINDIYEEMNDEMKENKLYQGYNKLGKKIYGRILTVNNNTIPNWIILLKKCCVEVNICIYITI